MASRASHNAKFATSKWVNNGVVNKRVQADEVERRLSEGFVLGRVPRVEKQPRPLCQYCGEQPLRRNATKYCSRLCANRAHVERHRGKGTWWTDPEQWAKYIRAHRYGMTVEELDQYLELHGGKCHICKRKDATCIDHCHTTGRARGMLCSNCNSILGFAYDEPEILESAIAYLESSVG